MKLATNPRFKETPKSGEGFWIAETPKPNQHKTTIIAAFALAIGNRGMK